MKKTVITIAASLALVVLLTGWGSTGHRVISMNIRQSFNGDMKFFDSWIPYISDHSSDADWRKKDDPDEFPRHFIDLDNYPSFTASGRISHDLDSCMKAFGEEFMTQNGFLPWATIRTYDSLVYYLKSGDYESGKRMAADLSHYVADGHMPLHLTRNYDGQFTDNDGIHFRYEITMIDQFETELSYDGMPAMEIPDVREYVFSYLYSNYPYADSVLAADDKAKRLHPDLESKAYYDALWKETSSLTNKMYRNASNAIASLLYTAWIEAGKPGIK